MAGGNRKVIVSESVSLPAAIAVDFRWARFIRQSGCGLSHLYKWLIFRDMKIFWADVNRLNIECSDYDGNNRKVSVANFCDDRYIDFRN